MKDEKLQKQISKLRTAYRAAEEALTQLGIIILELDAKYCYGENPDMETEWKHVPIIEEGETK